VKDKQKKCFEILTAALLTSSLRQPDPKRSLAINHGAGYRPQTLPVGSRGGPSTCPRLQPRLQGSP